MSIDRMHGWLKVAAIAAILATAGCGDKRGSVTTKYKTIDRPVRAACPERKVYEAIRLTRPVPLRKQEMPKSAAERVAKQSAQLGEYEGEGKWADRAMAALDRCQDSAVASP